MDSKEFAETFTRCFIATDKVMWFAPERGLLWITDYLVGGVNGHFTYDPVQDPAFVAQAFADANGWGVAKETGEGFANG